MHIYRVTLRIYVISTKISLVCPKYSSLSSKAELDVVNMSLVAKTICYSKTCVKRPFSKRLKIGFQYQLSLNTGLKYCRMLQGEHSAILLTFIKLPFVIKIFVLYIFVWPFYTGFNV